MWTLVSGSVRIPNGIGLSLLSGHFQPWMPLLVDWFRFLVGAGSSHMKDFQNGSGPCMHGIYDEVGTMKHNWSTRCQYNVTGWISMWACDMLSQ